MQQGGNEDLFMLFIFLFHLTTLPTSTASSYARYCLCHDSTLLNSTFDTPSDDLSNRLPTKYIYLPTYPSRQT
jgi:hypothetical protein